MMMTHLMLFPFAVAVHIQPQIIQVEHSVPLALSLSQELPQVVVEIFICHPEAELVGQSQGHDLLGNNRRSLRKCQSKFL